MLQGHAFFHILLGSKTTEVYTLVFEKIRELLPHLKIESLMTDYEYAIGNAAKKVFHNQTFATEKCLFHFDQAVYRKMQKVKVNYTLDKLEKSLLKENVGFHVSLLSF